MSLDRIIQFIKIYQNDIVLVLVIVLVSVASYNIGRIKTADESRPEIKVTKPFENTTSGILSTGQGRQGAQIIEHAGSKTEAELVPRISIDTSPSAINDFCVIDVPS